MRLKSGTTRQRQRIIGRFNAVYVDGAICDKKGMAPKAVLVMEVSAYGKSGQRKRLKIIHRLNRHAKLPVILVPEKIYNDAEGMESLLAPTNGS